MDKKKIRALSEKHGKNALALHLGVHPRTLQGWLNGRRPNASALVILKGLAAK